MFLRQAGFNGVADTTNTLAHIVVNDNTICTIGSNNLPNESCAIVNPSTMEIVGFYSHIDQRAYFTLRAAETGIRYILCKVLTTAQDIQQRERDFDTAFLNSMYIKPD